MDTVIRWSPNLPLTIEPRAAAIGDLAAPAAASMTAWILPTGTVLETGGVYLNLARPERGPFRALAGQTAGSRDRYVAMRDVSCDLWRRLEKSTAFRAAGIPEPIDRPVHPTDDVVIAWPGPSTAAAPARIAAP